MKQQFINQMRAGLQRQFEKLYPPKLDDGQLARVVLFECIDSSAQANYAVTSVNVQRKIMEDRHQVLINVNGEILLEFSLSLSTQKS